MIRQFNKGKAKAADVKAKEKKDFILYFPSSGNVLSLPQKQGFSSPSVSGGRVQLRGLGCSHSLLRHGSIPRALLTPALSPRCQSQSSRHGASAPLASEPLPAALRQLLGSQGRWRLSLRAVPASHSQLRVFPAKKCFFFFF